MSGLASMFSFDGSPPTSGWSGNSWSNIPSGDISLNPTMMWNPNYNLGSSVDWTKYGWNGPTLSYGNSADDPYTPTGLDPSFANWLSENGYSPASVPGQEGFSSGWRGIMGPNNQVVPGSQWYSNTEDNNFWNAAGLAAGVISGGVASASGMGAAGTGAVSGGVRGFVSDGTLGSTLKGAAAGGVAGYATPNVAGYVGIENPTLANAVNSGAKGAVSTALQGGDAKQVAQGALMSGTLAGLNSLGTQNMTSYQPTSGNQSLLNSINQSSGVSSTPSWMAADLGTPSGSSTYAANNSGFGITPSFNDSNGQPQTNYMDQLRSLLGMENGRIGVGVGGSQGIKYGDLAGGLMQLYAARKQRQDAKQLMGSITGNNGAYEANLRRTLMARDAAAGRRSNVGGREVQLQAALAQLAAQQAPSLINLQAAKDSAMMQGLQGLFTIGSRSGLFSGGQQTQPISSWTPSITPVSLPSLPDQSVQLMDNTQELPSSARWRQGY